MIEVTRWERRDGVGDVVNAIRWSGQYADIPLLRLFGATVEGYMTGPRCGCGDCVAIIDGMHALGPGEWLIDDEDYWVIHVDEWFHAKYRRVPSSSREAHSCLRKINDRRAEEGGRNDHTR